MTRISVHAYQPVSTEQCDLSYRLGDLFTSHVCEQRLLNLEEPRIVGTVVRDRLCIPSQSCGLIVGVKVSPKFMGDLVFPVLFRSLRY